MPLLSCVKHCVEVLLKLSVEVKLRERSVMFQYQNCRKAKVTAMKSANAFHFLLY